MMRKTRLSVAYASVLLLLLLPAAACSYRFDFVVVNESDEVVEVQYQLKRQTSGAADAFVALRPPAKLSLEEFEKSDPVWKYLTEGEYRFDRQAGTLTVSIAPGEALLVDYMNHPSDENQFHVAGIKLDGAKGSVSLEGRQAQTQFRLESTTKYVLRYK